MYASASNVHTLREKPECCSLVPLQELICDTCGQIIATPGEGLLQWKVRVNPYRMYNFAIIHDPQMSLHPGGCGISRSYDVSVSHAHLTLFTGENGLSKIF
ncbi:MAG: hypothetical protein U0411_02520 [Thermodesulfovibrionales bacterium]